MTNFVWILFLRYNMYYTYNASFAKINKDKIR